MVNQIYKKIPIIMMVLGFFLNDLYIFGWETKGGTFSDIFIIIGLLISIYYLKKVNTVQILALLTVMMIVLINIYIHINYYETGVTFSNSVIPSIKIISFTLYTIVTYNYVTYNRLEKYTLSCFVKAAVIFCLIGIYINLAILSEKLPYEFLWKYTRLDDASYAYKGNVSLVRMRSLASEPQFFGILLTIVLCVSYFNSIGYSISNKVDLFISICCILTFSITTVVTLILLKIVKNWKNFGLKYFLNKQVLIAFILVTLVYLFFKEEIDQTIIQRIILLLAGNDNSGNLRLSGSWSYIDNFFIGNGIGKTPGIWNNYAYILSDFGFIPFILFVTFSFYMCYINFYLGIFFVFFSFQRGGYLSEFYWITILLFFIASNNTKEHNQ